jgi:hypothetical protein
MYSIILHVKVGYPLEAQPYRDIAEWGDHNNTNTIWQLKLLDSIQAWSMDNFGYSPIVTSTIDQFQINFLSDDDATMFRIKWL